MAFFRAGIIPAMGLTIFIGLLKIRQLVAAYSNRGILGARLHESGIQPYLHLYGIDTFLQGILHDELDCDGVAARTVLEICQIYVWRVRHIEPAGVLAAAAGYLLILADPVHIIPLDFFERGLACRVVILTILLGSKLKYLTCVNQLDDMGAFIVRVHNLLIRESRFDIIQFNESLVCERHSRV